MQKGKALQGSDPLAKKRKKLVLGKGLDALIPDFDFESKRPTDYFHCEIELIRPNRFQPRRRFAENELNDLSLSIKNQGILQPLLVRKDDNGYELIAGERRLRAAKMAGLKQVPVVTKSISDKDMLELTIIENIQREDLNPLETAEAYFQLITEFELTQDQAAERVGKSRSSVANFLRLRQLPEQIKSSIAEGALSMGHARSLLGAPTAALQTAAYRMVISKGLSVRQTEALVKRLNTGTKQPLKPQPSTKDRHLSDLSDELSRQFGTKVQIKQHGKKGKVEIEFYSDEDLDRLLGLFNLSP
ncbi:MAG: ParB/RepB/Spo0J family partition protein [Desulfobacterales bacterium]|nr:ParB/RepB/Spo0J family partition protein [Desulfobacterales bacterium]